MWDLPGPGHEPVSPALAGEFLTTAPPEKPTGWNIDCTWRQISFLEPKQKPGGVERDRVGAAHKKSAADQASDVYPSQNLQEYKNYKQSDPAGLWIKGGKKWGLKYVNAERFGWRTCAF